MQRQYVRELAIQHQPRLAQSKMQLIRSQKNMYVLAPMAKTAAMASLAMRGTNIGGGSQVGSGASSLPTANTWTTNGRTPRPYNLSPWPLPAQTQTFGSGDSDCRDSSNSGLCLRRADGTMIWDPASPADTSAVLYAASHGHLNAITHLLKTNRITARDINMQDSSGKTALHYLAASKQNKRKAADIVRQILLIPGVNSNPQQSENSMTPLLVASMHGNLPVVNALLSSPTTEVNAVDSSGNGALHFACATLKHQQADQILRSLLSHGADPSANPFLMISALSAGRYEAALALLRSGRDIDVNAVDQNGRSALSLAIDRHASEVALLLLERGANPLVGKFNGISNLGAALETAQGDIALRILNSADEMKMDLTERNERGETFLHLLALHQPLNNQITLAIAERLLINRNTEDLRGIIPLKYASGELREFLCAYLTGCEL